MITEEGSEMVLMSPKQLMKVEGVGAEDAKCAWEQLMAEDTLRSEKEETVVMKEKITWRNGYWKGVLLGGMAGLLAGMIFVYSLWNQ